MAQEILNNILLAEKEANEIISRAEKSASDAVKNAETAVREQQRRAAVDHRMLYQQLIEEKRRSIAADIKAQYAGHEQQNIDKIKKAESNLDLAVKLIVDEVLHGHR